MIGADHDLFSRITPAVWAMLALALLQDAFWVHTPVGLDDLGMGL